MQEPLEPVNPAAVDPRLVPHLEPGETVLWQNQPKPGSFFGPSQIAGGLALIALGIALASGLIGPQLPDASRYAPAAAAAGTGLLLLITRWSRRAALWTYAITDRRLLSVLKGKVIRSVTPGQLDRFELRIKGDTVYWLKLIKRNLNGSGTARGPDGIFVGFHGQSDPEATRARIQGWRQAFSERASAGAADFAEKVGAAAATPSVDGKPAPPPAGVLRVRHPGTGLSLDVLADWKVTIKSRHDGPLRILGVKVLPRIIRDGPERPYGDTGSWNLLSVRGAPEAGLDLTIHDRPLETTLDAVLNDPFTTITATEILSSDPDLQIGPFRGFSVIRRMPGKEVRSVQALSAPAMLRQVWLGHAGMSLELQGYALESQQDVQNAIDAMVDSLTLQN